VLQYFPTPIGYLVGIAVSPDGVVFVPVSLVASLLVSMS
jgi:hypothetical protein